MTTETLTGKQRFRAHSNFLGKSWLVLQVEVHRTEPQTVGGLVPHVIEAHEFNYWRDAFLTDITEHNALQTIGKRKFGQETRLKFRTIGFSLLDMCSQKALVLQVRTHVWSEDAMHDPVENWEDAKVDDLALKLEIIS